jgi:phosphoribosylamine--glycine ligase
VIEFNVRFGDPETQVLVPLLMSDLLPALVAARDGVLDKLTLRWLDAACVCVVMAAKGYPGAYHKGSVIGGLDAADALDGVTVFHAGTAAVDGRITAIGGRVLGVTATAPTIAEAQAQAYAAVDTIDWAQGFCRRDIAWRVVGR